MAEFFCFRMGRKRLESHWNFAPGVGSYRDVSRDSARDTAIDHQELQI